MTSRKDRDTGEPDFEQLYQRYSKLALRAVNKLLRDLAQSEEVVQEVFLQCHRKLQEGLVLHHPKGFVLKTAYFLAMARKEAISRERALEELAGDHVFELLDAATELDLVLPPAGDPLSVGSPAWQSLVYWGRRLVATAMEQAPDYQRERLRLLMDSSHRREALAKLARLGKAWNKTAVSMTLGRYSARVERCLEQCVREGPKTPEDERHWRLIQGVRKVLSAEGPPDEPYRGLLNWVIRHVNAMDPYERHSFVFQIFFPN